MIVPRISFYFDRRHRASKTTKGSLEIEIYYNRRQYYVSTGITLLPEQWRKNHIVKCPDCAVLNARALKMMDRVQDFVMEQMRQEQPSLSKQHLKAVAEGNPITGEKRDFLKWLEERIKQRKIAESTRRQHMVMLRSIQASGLFVTFQDLTPVNIKSWDDILQRQLNCQSSVGGYHKRFKSYLNEAVQFQYILRSPYDHLRLKRNNSGSATAIKYLNEEEREAMEALELEGGEEIVRDMFIFSTYTGLAYSDLVKITRSDVKKEKGKLIIEDKRRKTGTGYRLVLLPKAVEILEKYDYNLNRMSNQKCNMYLKVLAHKIGHKGNLTMHMGRHTFATWALSKGVRIEVVSKMLAHAKISTTQIYAKLLQDEVEKGYEILNGQKAFAEDYNDLCPLEQRKAVQNTPRVCKTAKVAENKLARLEAETPKKVPKRKVRRSRVPKQGS